MYLQIADDRRGPQVAPPAGIKRLVHVQRDGSGAADSAEVDAVLGEEDTPPARRCRLVQSDPPNRRCSASPSMYSGRVLHNQLQSIAFDSAEACDSFVTDVIVNIQVVPAGMIPRMIVPHAVEHEFPKLLRVCIPEPERPVHGRLDPR